MNARGIEILLVPSSMTIEELNKMGIKPDATVEAEYGEHVIEAPITLAHHVEKYKNCPAPCNAKVEILPDNSVILISHIDLDTIGGCLALMGLKPEDDKFWTAEEFIDVNGPQYISKLPQDIQDQFNAYAEFSDKNRIQIPKDITDVIDIILQHGDVISKIISRDEELIQRGREWIRGAVGRVERCLTVENAYVRVFNSKEGIPCLGSYHSPMTGRDIPSTIVLNGKSKAISVAFADGGKQISAEDFVRSLWGQEAGGHSGIAGSPRGQEMTTDDLYMAANEITRRYKEVNKEYIKKEKEDMEL